MTGGPRFGQGFPAEADSISMGTLRRAVEQALEDLAQTGSIDLPRRVWERVEGVSRARKTLVMDVVAGALVALACHDREAYEAELSRLERPKSARRRRTSFQRATSQE